MFRHIVNAFVLKMSLASNYGNQIGKKESLSGEESDILTCLKRGSNFDLRVFKQSQL
jgi:hypothetical protein